MFRRILKEQRGAFMVFFAILVPLFIGMIGFAVDAGFIYMQKAKMQDIADAAALAGAARLNDENREGLVKNAVVKYATANGLKTYETNLTSLDNVANMNPGKDDFQIAQGIQENVMDKDGKQRDHVKVVIAKRVPTFFINVLFPDQKDGVVVKVAAAAEYVEGEEVVSYGGPRIIGSQIDPIYNSANSVVVPTGQNFTFVARADNGIDYDKLPINSVGTIYGVHCDYNTPQGWNYVNIQRKINSWDQDPYYKSEEEKKKAEEINSLCDSMVKKTHDEAYDKAKEVEKYKSGDTNKRYIGPGVDGTIKSNIKDSDTEIDLYIQGTEIKSYGGYDTNYSLIFDEELKNVKKINTLIVDKIYSYATLVIDSTGINYGDIYTLDNISVYISGKNNFFNGIIYCSGGEMYLGGENNHYITNIGGTKGVALIANSATISIGRTKKPVWDNNYYWNGEIYKSVSSYTERRESGTDWHMYWGDGSGSSSGSGSSGSDDSGDETKAHVRLVE